jgi:flagellar hook-length control protein FliK
MAVSSIDWNATTRRAASPGAVPSRGAAAVTFRLDPAAPDPRPRAAEARARDDRAVADDRNDRIASERARDAAATRAAAQGRDAAKAVADARAAKANDAEARQAKQSEAKAGEASPSATTKPGPAGAVVRPGNEPSRPGISDTAQAPRPDATATPGAGASATATAPAEKDGSGGTTAAGKTASADKPEEAEAATPATATPALLLPTAPPPTALASAAQGAAAAGARGPVPPEDPSGTAAPVVAVGPNPEGTATQGPPGLTVQAPAGRGDGSENGEPGNGKGPGDFAAELAPASDAGARTDLTAAVPAAPAPTHAKAAEAVAPSVPGAPAPAPVPLGAVPMTIGLRSLAGNNQFEIRLDPKDLGRIDVKLDIDKETGTVQAQLVVDRPETLALLQRDAGNLQQALNQAGLNAADGSINLSLRGDGPANGQSNGSGADGQRPDAGGASRSGAEFREPTPVSAVPLRRYGAVLGIDIRI